MLAILAYFAKYSLDFLLIDDNRASTSQEPASWLSADSVPDSHSGSDFFRPYFTSGQCHLRHVNLIRGFGDSEKAINVLLLGLTPLQGNGKPAGGNLLGTASLLSRSEPALNCRSHIAASTRNTQTSYMQREVAYARKRIWHPKKSFYHSVNDEDRVGNNKLPLSCVLEYIRSSQRPHHLCK